MKTIRDTIREVESTKNVSLVLEHLAAYLETRVLVNEDDEDADKDDEDDADSVFIVIRRPDGGKVPRASVVAALDLLRKERNRLSSEVDAALDSPVTPPKPVLKAVAEPKPVAEEKEPEPLPKKKEKARA